MSQSPQDQRPLEQALALVDAQMSEDDATALFAHLFEKFPTASRRAFDSLPTSRRRYLIRDIAPYLPLPTKGFEIEEEYNAVGASSFGIKRLLENYDFTTVLDIGSGSGKHARLFQQRGKQVTTIDLGTSIYAARAPSVASDPADENPIRKLLVNVNDVALDEQFDCVWASHILEHQLDCHKFLKQIKAWTRPEGVIAITVPPLKFQVVGGHVSLWTPGHLLYNMVLAGIDCAQAEVYRYRYNITAIVRNRSFKMPALTYDSGDITLLRPWLPKAMREGINGFKVGLHPRSVPSSPP